MTSGEVAPGVTGRPAKITVTGLPVAEPIVASDDLVTRLLDAVDAAHEALRDGDVVCVASKVVALTEGRSVVVRDEPDAVRELARREAAEVVADTPVVLVVRTRHGHVVANAGIDRSNVAEGSALLLPEDPDASADAMRQQVADRTGADVAIVVTDTFGRPWRNGQTDVALGISGMAAVRDERGGNDLVGRPLHVTVAAVGDAVAAASDLARTKASATPFVLVRGVDRGGGRSGAGALVRPVAEDLFRFGGPTATEAAFARRRTIRSFVDGTAVPERVLTAAVRAAATAPAPHHSRPWRFVRLHDATRARLLDAMADQWRADLRADGTPDRVIDARIHRSDAVLRHAPTLVAAFVSLEQAHRYLDDRRSRAERDLFLLSAGAALQSVQVVLDAHGVGCAWMSSTAFCDATVRDVLDLPDHWVPVGMLAAGQPARRPPPRPVPDVEDLLDTR